MKASFMLSAVEGSVSGVSFGILRKMMSAYIQKYLLERGVERSCDIAKLRNVTDFFSQLSFLEEEDEESWTGPELQSYYEDLVELAYEYNGDFQTLNTWDEECVEMLQSLLVEFSTCGEATGISERIKCVLCGILPGNALDNSSVTQQILEVMLWLYAYESSDEITVTTYRSRTLYLALEEKNSKVQKLFDELEEGFCYIPGMSITGITLDDEARVAHIYVTKSVWDATGYGDIEVMEFFSLDVLAKLVYLDELLKQY